MESIRNEYIKRELQNRLNRVPQEVLKKLTSEHKPQVLKEGEVFQGEILDIRNNQLLIQLENQQKILAKLQQQLEVSIGDKMMFLVKESNEEQIVLRPLVNEQLDSLDKTIVKALDAAGMPINEKNIEIVKALIAKHQPIDKQTLGRTYQQSILFPEAALEDIILLDKLLMPVSEENLNQLNHYKNYEHRIVKEMETALKQLPEILSRELVLKNPEIASKTYGDILDILIQPIQKAGTPLASDTLTYPTQGEFMSSMQTVFSQAYPILKLQQALDHVGIKLTANQLKELPVYELLARLRAHTGEATVKNMLNTPEISDFIKDCFEKQWILEPRMLGSKERVTQYYTLVEEQTQQLSKVLKSHDTSSIGSSKSAENIKDNIDFMKGLNQLFTYIQLPIRLKDHPIHSELYILTDKNELAKNKDSITALLHLDLAYLGLLDIYLIKEGTSVQGHFYTENDDIKDQLRTGVHKLVEQLAVKGYHLYPQFMNREEEKKAKESFVKPQQEGQVKRYSFDIRV